MKSYGQSRRSPRTVTTVQRHENVARKKLKAAANQVEALNKKNEKTKKSEKRSLPTDVGLVALELAVTHQVMVIRPRQTSQIKKVAVGVTKWRAAMMTMRPQSSGD